jgi:hypothetical protein
MNSEARVSAAALSRGLNWPQRSTGLRGHQPPRAAARSWSSGPPMNARSHSPKCRASDSSSEDHAGAPQSFFVALPPVLTMTSRRLSEIPSRPSAAAYSAGVILRSQAVLSSRSIAPRPSSVRARRWLSRSTFPELSMRFRWRSLVSGAPTIRFNPHAVKKPMSRQAAERPRLAAKYTSVCASSARIARAKWTSCLGLLVPTG